MSNKKKITTETEVKDTTKLITTEKLDNNEPIINTKITTEKLDNIEPIIEVKKEINIIKENITNTDNKIKPVNKTIRYRKIVKRF